MTTRQTSRVFPQPTQVSDRSLLWHRHRLVQMRTWIVYQLQALAMNEGYRWKKKLFGEQRTSTVRKAVWPIDLPKLSHIVAFPRSVHARADGGTFRV